MLLMLFLGCFDTTDKSSTRSLSDQRSSSDSDDNSSTQDNSTCARDEVEDCNGSCTPSWWLGDGECDSNLNCAELNYDDGDCNGGGSDSGMDWDTDQQSFCDDAIEIGTAGTFSAETVELTWRYDADFDGVIAGPYFFNFPSDLEGISFTLESGDYYTQPIYFGNVDGYEKLIDLNSNYNPIKTYWDQTNTVVMPMSPSTEPLEGCVGVYYWGSDENNYSVPEGTTSTLHINSRRFSSGDSYTLNFVVVNSSDVSEDEVNEIWYSTKTLFDQLGIDITASYFETIETGAGGYIYADSSDAYEIMATPPANQTDSRDLNIYIVDAILDSNGEMSTFGYAGGVPGPIGVVGTQNSGVIVSLDMHRLGNGSFDYVEFGATIAHELGHQLGLFHTTEADGSDNDILSDTPECNLSYDNGDYSLDPTECPDGDHVMFWTTPNGAFPQDKWSSQQRDVLISSPMIFE